MENSLFLARIVGWFFIIVAAGMSLNSQAYQKIMEDFSKNTALVYLSGIFTLLIGFLMVSTHNIWRADWTLIITIFGWLGFIKGVWLLLLPNTVAKITAAYQKKASLLVAYAVVMLALGIFLVFKGYFIF
jgi:uncharacterized membrane protein